MSQSAHTQTAPHAKPHAGAHALLPAVVGPLVLCVVLVPAAAQSGALASPEWDAGRATACDQAFPRMSDQPVRASVRAPRAFPRAAVSHQLNPVVLNNMIGSANGKRLALTPSLTRAEAGNLNSPRRSIP
jgi:hypothetical protein